MSANVELTVFSNKRGRLSKSLSVDAAGNLVKEPMGSLFEGIVRRYRLANGAKSLAELFDKMQAPHALALGRLRADIPDKSPITIKGKEYQGAITRTGGNIVYEPGAPAFLLVDLDTKGCPPEIVARLKAEGLVALLARTVPAIATTARVQRASTSSGLYRSDTQQKFPDSDGQHLYLLVADGSDIPRSLAVLFKRCWLAGLGWISLSKSGAALKRGIIDAAVDAPERLVFEGAPEIKPPLAQDADARKAIVTNGNALDTVVALPELDAQEEAEYERLVKEAIARAKPEQVRVEREYRNKQSEAIAKEQGIPVEKARIIVEKRMGGLLQGSDVILFAYIGDATVAEILADPERFNEQPCADPIEGAEYGRTTAKVYLNPGTGKPMVHSFAHGATFYRLQHDVHSLKKRLETAGQAAADIVVPLAVDTDLSAAEEDELLRLAAGLSGCGLRPLQADLKAAKAGKKEATKKATRTESNKPTIRIGGGRISEAVDQLDRAVAAVNPPIVYHRAGLVRVVRVPNAVVVEKGIVLPEGSVEIKPLCDADGRLVAADHAVFESCIMDEWVQVDPPKDYITSWRERGNSRAPVLRAVSPVPIMRYDGSIDDTGGYDRESCLYYGGGVELNVPSQPDAVDVLEALEALLMPFSGFPLESKSKPRNEDIDMAVLLSALFSLALRPQLRLSPLHGISARASRTGKGLLIKTLCTLVTGSDAATMPPVNATTDEQVDEEDRKRFTALLRRAPAAAHIDNVTKPLGSDPMCTLLTSDVWTDRVLGRSEDIKLPNTVQMFASGNNLTLKGDMVGRSLMLNMNADVECPERRKFEITDLSGFVLKERPKLLSALFTLLRAYRQGGRPGAGDVTLGAFEMWSQEVGGLVRWLGYPDPIESQKQLAADDEVRDTNRDLLFNWYRLIGETWVTANDVLKAITEGRCGFSNENTPSADSDAMTGAATLLADILGRGIKSRELHPKSVGIFLKKRKDTIAGGLQMQVERDDCLNANRFRVVQK